MVAVPRLLPRRASTTLTHSALDMAALSDDDTIEKTWQAMQACVDHARDLLETAKIVHAADKPHIAYHLAALALEELGRRELIAVESASSQAAQPPTWLSKHTQNHVRKLFWAFFGANFLSRQLTKESLEEMNTLARAIHANRLAGLYVESSEDGLNLPREAISKEESEQLIELVNTRFEMAASQRLRTDVSEEEREHQRWFLATSDDPERRRQLLSPASLEKLAELKDSRAWIKWLRELFAQAEAEAHEALQEELQRSKSLPRGRTQDKWKVRIRIFSDSHSIRPKVLNVWNESSRWIKLVPVPAKKNQMIVEFIFGDDVPLEGLWFFGWGIARQFVTALNIGTMGFWWWRLPEQISRYYETLEDLEKKRSFAIERNPSLKIDWGPNRTLTAEELSRVAMCLAALPRPNERDKHAPYNHYIGGITFLSLNDVHWQCELQAYGAFHESLKAMMRDAGAWDGDQAFEIPFTRFLTEMFPSMSAEEQERFVELCRHYEARKFDGLVVSLKEASFIKLFCDAYFLRTVGPAALKDRPQIADKEEKL